MIGFYSVGFALFSLFVSLQLLATVRCGFCCLGVVIKLADFGLMVL